MKIIVSAIRFLDELVSRYPNLACLRHEIETTATAICEAHQRGGKVLVCGNGGSAADSEHIVGEMMKGYLLKRRLTDGDVDKLRKVGLGNLEELAQGLQRGIQAIALTGHPSLSTAVANDISPYLTFAQQAYVYGHPGDILMGLSTSGNSINVVNALKIGRAFGMKNIGFTGSIPCEMDYWCDIILKVPETETFKVQEYHMPIYHAICAMVEEHTFGEDEE